MWRSFAHNHKKTGYFKKDNEQELKTISSSGQTQTTDQPQPIVAIVGDDVILPCHLEPAMDAVSMTVEWARADLNPRFVHVRRDNGELLIDQNPSYIGRTSLSISKLKCGDLSLKISKVKLSDEGTYRCHIPTQRATSMVKLAVGKLAFVHSAFEKKRIVITHYISC